MLRPGGRIGFVCWRSLRDNELDFLPLDAAGLEAAGNEAHLSFERPSFIEGVMQAAGFDGIAIEPFDGEVSCGNADATLEVVMQVGRSGRSCVNTLPCGALRSRAFEPPWRGGKPGGGRAED